MCKQLLAYVLVLCTVLFFLIIRLPPRATLTDTLLPYTTLVRSRGPESSAPVDQVSKLVVDPSIRIQLPVRSPTRSIRGSRSARATPISAQRSEEHTSELQSLMRISYAVFCLKKKNQNIINYNESYSAHDRQYNKLQLGDNH